MTAAATADQQGVNREVRLVRVSGNLPVVEDFAVVQAPMPRAEPGDVLVRNRYFPVFPGLRTLIGGEARDVPLPPLRAGDTLFGPAIGEVVTAPDDSALRPGDLVRHMLGWREFAAVPAAECFRPAGELPDPVAYLSMGSAPYGALTRLAKVREGDVVLVTGAAGAVGTLAGQIARLLGASRVIGTTSSEWKARRLVSELGYDAVVLRGKPLEEQLADAAPDGIDVVLDNVGGGQLVAALEAARRRARIVLVGALSGQFAARGAGGGAPVEIDTFRVVNKGIELLGYAGMDHPDVDQEWIEQFGAWLRAGSIRFPYTELRGIDSAPSALPSLIGGQHFGSVVVAL